MKNAPSFWPVLIKPRRFQESIALAIFNFKKIKNLTKIENITQKGYFLVPAITPTEERSHLKDLLLVWQEHALLYSLLRVFAP
jgi:hypothetical protein